MIQLITWRHRFHITGPRIPAAPLKQDGEGAQYGLRKSQRCDRYRLLPELRQGALPQLRAQRRRGPGSLRTVLGGMAECTTESIYRASCGRAESIGRGSAGTYPR